MQFSITETPNNKVYTPRLEREINESSINETLERIDTEGNSVSIIFLSILSQASNDILSNIISSHSGESYPKESHVQKVEVSTPVINNAFASKGDYHFRGSGKKFTCPANTTTSCEYPIEYGHVKFNGINLLSGNSGDTCNLKILDNSTGTFSSIPDYTLDQFGFDWNVMSSGTKEMLPYVADLYQTMRIVIEYTNNTDSELELMVNYYIHEE